MQDNPIQSLVLTTIARYLPSGAPNDLPGKQLREELGLKSMQMAAALTSICDEAGIDLFLLSDLDLVRMKTVQDVIDVLTEKAAA